MYTTQLIAQLIESKNGILQNAEIDYLLTDSRRLIFPEKTLFFAITTARNDGHFYIAELYEQGVRNFVVNESFIPRVTANYLKVPDVLVALQKLAAHHRSNFDYEVVGITGSNGKTIVKEWLFQLLHNDYQIVRSPRSYNSQIGVPLSVWQMQANHQLALFEAGISAKGEMQQLEKIIQPTIGIFTYLGEAHKEGFNSHKEKAVEKLKLFINCNVLIYNKDSLKQVVDIEGTDKNLLPNIKRFISWSRECDADLRLLKLKNILNGKCLTLLYQNKEYDISIPFTDDASVENALTCICFLLYKQYDIQQIAQKMMLLQSVEMRMQLKKGINQCTIINDSYSNDLSSLNIALDYLQQQSGNNKKTVIISDILQSGMPLQELYANVAAQCGQRQISKLIIIGEQISQFVTMFQHTIPQVQSFANTSVFFQQTTHHQFANEYILLKGARLFEFEKISDWLSQKVHQTVMEINLTAMAHNLLEFRKQLQTGTKIMAMVKAFSYGSGSVEVARLLQFHKVDYLAVAYADEGIELRKGGIHLPIMVMSADEASFEALVTYHLEPEIFSFGILEGFNQYLQNQGIKHFPVHIKLNTGMNRLGFEFADMPVLAQKLLNVDTMVVKSFFSHLVASDNPAFDQFTLQQSSIFAQAASYLYEQLKYPFIWHIDNSSGIFRHPELQYHMVRLGIGLYGVNSSSTAQLPLETVATLKTTIAQIRQVPPSETIGYNKMGVLKRESKIATLRIGYADGFNRKMGNGNAVVWINGKLAPTVGNVCMDMVMVDVTEIPEAKENDEVEIFGKNIAIQNVANCCETIAYEVLTSVSQRVKRIYLQE